MSSAAILLLTAACLPLAQRLQGVLPGAEIYGLAGRVAGPGVVAYDQFGETARSLFQSGRPIIGLCAAGILIRTLAPLLGSKWQEPPVLAIAADGSAVVPLLGGTQGVNALAQQLAAALQIAPAITSSGDLRFGAALLSPPPGYRLLNPEHAKTFIAELLAGATVRLVGSAAWLADSRLPLSPEGQLTLAISPDLAALDLAVSEPGPTCLVYQEEPLPKPAPGRLAIVGTGPGSAAWLSPQALAQLQAATDWVGYQSYLDLAEPWRLPHTHRHPSDNRVELDRARFALNLAAQGRQVALVSSGDPGIYAMAAAVFEVLETAADPAWGQIEIEVCPGISAMQAAAAQVGAPLGHDFCAISLSDILKPWEAIAQRITAAAQADFAIAFYNPISRQRTWQLAQAKALLLQWRAAETPVVLARNLGRPGQSVRVKPLAELSGDDADMRTVILVGSSKTRQVQQGDRQWLYTPRRY